MSDWFAPFVRHAVLYGDECVVETAFSDPACEGAHRLRAAIAFARRQAGRKDAAPRRCRMPAPALRAQVTELRGRGVVPAAIADVLNVSDRRVREVLRDE